jgi:hypothetical protein
MSDFPKPGLYPFPVGLLSPSCDSCPCGDATVGTSQAWNGGAVWPVANTAIFVPVLVPFRARIFQLGIYNGAAVSGNVDVGLYDEQGKRLISSGSQVQAGVSALQMFDVADTDVGPGLIYIASVLSNIVGAVFRSAPPAQLLRALGVRQQTLGALPLPANATFETLTQQFVPYAFAVYQSAVF